MYSKKIISLHSETKPFDINTIKKYLIELNKKKEFINDFDKKKLEAFHKYYGLSESSLIIPYEYEEGNFIFNITPIAGYSFDFLGKLKNYTRVGGVRVYSSYNKIFNIYALIQDSGEFGDFVDTKKEFTSQRGYVFIPAPNGIEYSDIIGGLILDFDWLNLGIVKDYNRWGSGEFGQIILSDKVNSFPHFKLEYNPTDWLRFRYLLGWLNSQVIDSSKFYNSQPGSKLNEERYNFINKYLVINLLTFQPFKFLQFSMGNSFIYSGDNIRLETLIPLTLFKYMDRDVGKGSVADGNGQMFFDFNFNYFSNLKIYGTWFIDVISVRKTLNRDFSENWFGYTLGGKIVDPLIENFEFQVEYSKVDPWVYEHKDISTTYKHLNYQLGHWIGQNADLYNLRIKYFPLYNLSLTFDFQYFRKGGLDDIYYAYSGRDEKQFKFLYPPLRKELTTFIGIEYEFYKSLLIQLKYKYSNIKDDDINRTPQYLIGRKDYISLGFQFGFPY